MNPALYILARTDIDSMNSGKLAAQASHAANAFVKQVTKYEKNPANYHPNNRQLTQIVNGFHEWENSTVQGFGTVICLDGGVMSEIQYTADLFKQNGYIAGVVHDPSYPLRDGVFTHLIPLDTCAYIFVPDRDAQSKFILDKFNLYE